MRKIKRKRKTQNKKRPTARSEDFIMKPSVDWCFKELMRNPKTRKGFIAVLLQVKPEEIDETILLENELPKFREEGFRVMYSNQAYPASKFLDVGAVVFHASVCPWEFPNFSVETCQEALLGLQSQLERYQFIPNREHRFVVIAKNRK